MQDDTRAQGRGRPGGESLARRLDEMQAELSALSVQLDAERAASARTRRGALAVLLLGAALVPLGAVALPARIEFEAGEPIVAQEINDDFRALWDEAEQRVIREDLTLNAVDCADLQGYLVELGERTIASSARVVIKLPAGNFACPGTVRVDHADGGHIEIIGQGSGETTLSFSNTAGIEVPPGRSLGALEGVMLRGTDAGGDGVSVGSGATAQIGPDVLVRDFVEGILTVGGQVRANGVRCESNEHVGFDARLGGVIEASGSVSDDNGSSGFVAFLGGTILADGAVASANHGDGFGADTNAAIYVGNGSSIDAEDNDAWGFRAQNGATIVAAGTTTATGNGAGGFYAEDDSFVQASGAVSSGNPSGFVSTRGSFMFLLGSPTGDSLASTPDVNAFDEARMSGIIQQ